MKIFVCVKYVPDTAAYVSIVDGNGFDDSVKHVVNPYDEFAIEEAIQIKERTDGEIIVVTLGKAHATAAIRFALAMGADRGIHIKVDEILVDTMTTVEALKIAIEQAGAADLVLMGKQSVDSEGMQTPYYLGEALGLHVATDVIDLVLEKDQAIVQSDLGNNEIAEIELDLPCVIGATKGLNEPRSPKLPNIIKAKKKPIEEIALEDLVPSKPVNRTSLISFEYAPERSQAILFEGDTAVVVEQLVEVFKEKALI